MKKSHGFTLIELMVVIAIVAILSAIAAPSFKTAIQSSNMTSGVNSFLADMRFARSEAIRRGGSVVMCRSSNPEAATPSCSTAPATEGWQNGWVIFHDNLTLNGNFDANETKLRVQSPITGIDSIVDLMGTPLYKFTFSATGRVPTTNIAYLKFGGANYSAEAKRVVCVNVGGYARISGNGNTICP